MASIPESTDSRLYGWHLLATLTVPDHFVVVVLFTAVLGSGVPLPKILNIDFSNADINVLEVWGEELYSPLCSMPRNWEEDEKGGEEWGQRCLFLQRLREQDTKLKSP